MFDWLFLFPATTWGLLLFAAMLVAALLGHAFHRRSRSRAAEDSQYETQEGYTVSSVVTLFAFIIGFTYAVALDRFETRRLLVGEDARAIQELYLRAQMLEEPHRSRLSDLLVRYTDNRLELAKEIPAKREQALAENDRLIRDIWTAMIPAFESVRGIDFSSTFVDSANKVIEMNGARVEARNARIPAEIFIVMFAYAIATALIFGYVLQGRRGRISGSTLLVLSILAMMLLLDLNQPVTGMIRESQEQMEKLSEWLHADPPGTFDGLKDAGQATPAAIASRRP